MAAELSPTRLGGAYGDSSAASREESIADLRARAANDNAARDALRAIEGRDVHTASGLAVGINLVDYGRVAGDAKALAEAVRIFRSALTDPGDDRGTILLQLGNALAELGELDSRPELFREAKQAYDEALGQWQAAPGDPRLVRVQINRARASAALAELSANRSEAQQAIAALDDVMPTIWRSSPDWPRVRDTLASALLTAHGLEPSDQLPERAVTLYREAIDWWQEHGDQRNTLRAHNNLGTAHLALREYDEAVRAFSTALELDGRQQNPRRSADVQLNLADGQRRRAVEPFESPSGDDVDRETFARAAAGLSEAIASYGAGIAALRRAGVGDGPVLASAQARRAIAYASRAGVTGRLRDLDRSLALLRRWTPKLVPTERVRAQFNFGVAFATRAEQEKKYLGKQTDEKQKIRMVSGIASSIAMAGYQFLLTIFDPVTKIWPDLVEQAQEELANTVNMASGSHSDIKTALIKIVQSIVMNVDDLIKQLAVNLGIPSNRVGDFGESILNLSKEYRKLLLPDKAPFLYADRHNYPDRPELANLRIVDFIREVWRPWLGTLSQPDLRRLDPGAYSALHDWLRKNQLPPDLKLPNRKEIMEARLAAVDTETVRAAQRLIRARERRRPPKLTR